jgi:hypothetical protein
MIRHPNYNWFYEDGVPTEEEEWEIDCRRREIREARLASVVAEIGESYTGANGWGWMEPIVWPITDPVLQQKLTAEDEQEDHWNSSYARNHSDMPCHYPGYRY